MQRGEGYGARLPSRLRGLNFGPSGSSSARPNLKTVVLRAPVNEWLGPMKEAPSNERASLVSATPPMGKAYRCPFFMLHWQ